jgi:hypothetical protein
MVSENQQNIFFVGAILLVSAIFCQVLCSGKKNFFFAGKFLNMDARGLG